MTEVKVLVNESGIAIVEVKATMEETTPAMQTITYDFDDCAEVAVEEDDGTLQATIQPLFSLD